MSDPFLGQITVFPYGFAPLGWAECVGQLLPIRQYSALFSLLGTNFGGDGTTTFGPPNLSGRISVGMGTSTSGTTYAIGDLGGHETTMITPSSMPPHNHSFNASSADGTVQTPNGKVLANVFKGDFTGGNQDNIYNPGPPNTALPGMTIGPAGGQQPHNNIQPSLALRYCIALQGVFPPRS